MQLVQDKFGHKYHFSEHLAHRIGNGLEFCLPEEAPAEKASPAKTQLGAVRAEIKKLGGTLPAKASLEQAEAVLASLVDADQLGGLAAFGNAGKAAN